jgi:DNA-binding MarR family transcriptional regulator
MPTKTKASIRERKNARPAVPIRSSRQFDLPEPVDFIPITVRMHNNLLLAFEKVCGIHLARWRLLFVIGRKGRCAQIDLSNETTIGPSVVTRIVKDLHRQKLILREASADDNRRTIVALSDKGRDLVRAIASKRAEFLKETLRGLSRDEIATLEGLMQRVHDNLAEMK